MLMSSLSPFFASTFHSLCLTFPEYMVLLDSWYQIWRNKCVYNDNGNLEDYKVVFCVVGICDALLVLSLSLRQEAKKEEWKQLVSFQRINPCKTSWRFEGHCLRRWWVRSWDHRWDQQSKDKEWNTVLTWHAKSRFFHKSFRQNAKLLPKPFSRLK